MHGVDCSRRAPRRGLRLWFVLAFAGLVLCRPAFSAVPAGYYLVWADEFNGATLDTSKWNYWLAGPRRDAINTASAVSVSSGKLVITTYTASGTHYTGMIATDNKFRTKFGYWEASIDWNDAPGMWSAYWMQSPTMGADISDPVTSGCEIDIAEHRSIDSGGTDISGKVQANIHWNGYGAAHQSQGSGNVGSGLNAGLHTYGFKWTASAYDFTIDGVTKWTGGSSPVSHSTEFMILSSEVDNGSWAGDIPAGGYGSLGTSTTKMTVDYVRYYAPTNTRFWTGASSALWTDPANWISNMIPDSGSDLTFSYLSSGNLSNVLGQDVTVDSLTVLETTSPFSVNGANTLYLGAGGVDMISLSKDAAFNGRVVISGAPAWTIGSGRTLTVNSNLAGVGGSGVITKAGKGSLVIGVSNTINKSILATAGALALSSGVSNQYSFRATGSGAITALMGPSPARCASLDLTNASLNFSFGTVSNLFGAGIVVPQLNLVGSNAVNITGLNLPLTNATLMTYTSKSGGGSFFLGSLPDGTEATLSDTGAGLVLNVTKWPQVLTWHGAASGTWNTNGLTLDWNSGSAPYQQYGTTADSVVFDDSAVDYSVALSQAVSPASVTVDNEINAYTFNTPGKISGATTLVKRGTNTLTLNTLNNYTGNTTISDGRAVIGAAGGLYYKAGGTKLTVNNGGTLSLTGNLNYDRGAFGYLPAQASGLVLDGGTFQHTGTSNPKTIDGAGRLFTIGSGGATLDSGTAGQTFAIGYRYDYSSSLTSSSGGSLELTGAGNGDLNYMLPGSGGLLKSGAGTWSLTAPNSFSGPAEVEAGVLNLQTGGALGSAANGTTVNYDARLELEGGITVGSEPLAINGTGGAGFFYGALHSKSGANVWGGPLTIAGAGTRIGASPGATLEVSGVINSGTDAFGLTVRPADSTASVILSGANTYVGDTTVVGGILRLAGGNNRLPIGTQLVLGASTVSGALDLNGRSQEIAAIAIVQTGGTLANLITNSSVTSCTLTVNTPASSISTNGASMGGSLALTKTGGGTLRLGGPATFTGNTLVKAGTLVVDGSLGGGAVSVNSGGTLAGSGTLNGPVILLSNGSVAPGLSGLGRLTFATSLTLQSGSFTRMEVNAAAATNDQLIVAGSFVQRGGEQDW